MPHKFDVKRKHILENKERENWFPSVSTLMELGVSRGMTVADIGCGTGYLTLPAAQIVGEEGHVYAVDISREMLLEVEKKIKGKKSNITPLLSDENSIPLEDSSVDYCLMAFLLHEVEDPEVFLGEVKRILRKPGAAGVIEWRKVNSPMGPPMEDRIPREVMERAASRAGFRVERTVLLGCHHYGMRWLYV
jgi:ubiquinone/menaquinone biosynthesis C-methylase UbiE